MSLKYSFSNLMMAWSEGQSDYLFLKKPKCYFTTKFILLAGIVLQRILILADGNPKVQHALSIIQVAGLPLLLLCESLLFYWVRKNKRLQRIADLVLGGFQIIILEFIIGLTMPISNSFDDKLAFVLLQEVLFVCIHTIMFINSFPVNIGLLFYACIAILFRLSPELESKYYAGWSIMMASLVASFFIILLSKRQKTEDQTENFEELQNIPCGLAVLTLDKQVVFMNSTFKGITETSHEKMALEKLLKMKIFHPHSDVTLNSIVSKIEVRSHFNEFVHKDDYYPTGGLFSNQRSYELSNEQIYVRALIFNLSHIFS